MSTTNDISSLSFHRLLSVYVNTTAIPHRSDHSISFNENVRLVMAGKLIGSYYKSSFLKEKKKKH